MNYYIQGNKDKAKEIEAAFKKIGYDVTGFDMCNDNILFFTYKLQTGANVISTTNAHLYTANIIKTHPDYQELELPVEPTFKEGDWIVQNDNGTVSQITKTINGKDEYGEYRAYEHTNGYFAACFENEYHLWTIQDAKEGDVLANDHHILILKELVYDWSSNGTPYSVKAYCGIKPNGNFEIGKDNWSFCGTLHIHSATKEQRDLLFKKMKEAGYEWDADKKELKLLITNGGDFESENCEQKLADKVEPKAHYDIANFKPFDRVLVRQDDSCTWGASFFGRYAGMFMCCNNACFIQCIPYNDDTKHLLGTTDMCDEQYINW